jgi:glycerol-3-phosphate acyltransferase PlsX
MSKNNSSCAPPAQRGKPRIAVDAMGGDHGPGVVISGAVAAAKAADGGEDENIHLVLVGKPDIVEAELAKLETSDISYEIVAAEEVVTMDDKPSDVLRRKKNSSIHEACRLVKEGLADGVVSAGNSGATAACGMFVVGRLPGVERPALASIMPTVKGHVIIIDVGANVDSRPLHLHQFGIMAHVLAKDVLCITKPRVGLLSNGEEESKGNALTKEAYEMLSASDINFIGNIEGRDIYAGEVDVVVCDGFVGNVVLKLSESLGLTLAGMLKREIMGSFWGKVGALFAKGTLKRFRKKVDHSEYGGAPLLGLNGIVIVCHGAAGPKSISNAVKMAARFVESEAVEHLGKKLSKNILSANGDTQGPQKT